MFWLPYNFVGTLHTRTQLDRTSCNLYLGTQKKYEGRSFWSLLVMARVTG